MAVRARVLCVGGGGMNSERGWDLERRLQPPRPFPRLGGGRGGGGRSAAGALAYGPETGAQYLPTVSSSLPPPMQAIATPEYLRQESLE